MSRQPSPPRILAVLKLPEYDVPLLVVTANGILQRMADSSFFPTPQPPLAIVQTAVDALHDAQVATLSKTVDTFATRDARKRNVVALLQQLQTYVQSVANGDPDNAAAIIESAGMHVKKKSGPPPRVFAVTQGRVSGSVDLEAPQAAERAAYEWAFSIDDGVTWTIMPVTVQADTTISGFTPATRALFRYRVSAKNGTGDWCDPIAFIVS